MYMQTNMNLLLFICNLICLQRRIDGICCKQGITLKVNDDGCCMVARIMHGGMIHKQGQLQSLIIQQYFSSHGAQWL